MIWLVSYDIASPKRLQKIAHYCEKFGIRLQKSTFQIDSDKEHVAKMIEGLNSLMNKKKDSIIVYPICEDCRRLSITDGPNNIIATENVVFL